jgi:hypothetical protein
LCKWEGKERGRIAKKFSKIFFSPVSEGRRICTVPFKMAPCLFFIFFERKGNGFGSDPKMGYDSCPLLTMFTKQNSSMFCVVSFIKKTKKETVSSSWTTCPL